MTRSLDKLGYRTILPYANGDILSQTAQTEALLARATSVRVMRVDSGFYPSEPFR